MSHQKRSLEHFESLYYKVLSPSHMSREIHLVTPARLKIQKVLYKDIGQQHDSNTLTTPRLDLKFRPILPVASGKPVRVPT